MEKEGILGKTHLASVNENPDSHTPQGEVLWDYLTE